MSKPDPKIRTITLEEPLNEGQPNEVKELQLRKPVAGDARGGISLAKLGLMDVDELLKLLPRIAMPLISPTEADAIALPDLMAIGDAVTDFLLTKAQKAALSQTA